MTPKSKERIRQRIAGIVLLFLGSVLLIVFLILLFLKLTAPRDIAFLLPHAETIFFVEASTAQPSQTSQYHDAIRAAFTQWFSTSFGVDVERDIAPWFSDVAAFALVRDTVRASTVYPIVFLETDSRAHVRETLLALRSASEEKKFLEENIDGTPVFSFPLSRLFYFTFVNRYVVVSPDRAGIQAVIRAATGKQPHLRRDLRYLTVFHALPRERLLRGYAAFPQSSDALLLSGLGGSLVRFLTLQKPMVDLLQSIGLSGKIRRNTLTLQTFFAFRPGISSRGSSFSSSGRYRGALLSLLPPSATSFFGGAYLRDDGERLLEILERQDQNGARFLRGNLLQAIQSFLGFLPDPRLAFLLDEEYALAFLPDRQLAGAVTLPKNLPADAAALFTVAASAIAAHAFPISQSVSLSDGTEASETVVAPERFSEERWGDDLFGFHAQGSDRGFFVGMRDHVLFFATNRPLVDEMIARQKQSVVVLDDPVWNGLVADALTTAQHVFGFSQDTPFFSWLPFVRRGLFSLYAYPSGMIGVYAFPVDARD